MRNLFTTIKMIFLIVCDTKLFYDSMFWKNILIARVRNIVLRYSSRSFPGLFWIVFFSLCWVFDTLSIKDSSIVDSTPSGGNGLKVRTCGNRNLTISPNAILVLFIQKSEETPTCNGEIEKVPVLFCRFE